jgi:hypothetical protein
MMAMMIMTMVMINVRTQAGTPKKNVSKLCADHRRGILVSTRLVFWWDPCCMQWLWRLCSPNKVNLSLQFTFRLPCVVIAF